MIETNLTGTFVCCRAAGRRMVKAGRGSIVNLASTLGLVGFPGTVAYVASKGGVVHSCGRWPSSGRPTGCA